MHPSSSSFKIHIYFCQRRKNISHFPSEYKAASVKEEITSHIRKVCIMTAPAVEGTTTNFNKLDLSLKSSERGYCGGEASSSIEGELTFDEVLKLWMFKLSFWNASRNYEMSKDWERFVKKKNLKTDDIISFEHDVGGGLYVGCRRHPYAPPNPGLDNATVLVHVRVVNAHSHPKRLRTLIHVLNAFHFLA